MVNEKSSNLAASFSEVNAITSSSSYRHGQGRGRNKFWPRSGHNKKSHYKKWIRDEPKQEKGKVMQNKSQNDENKCYKYGCKGHWSYTYCTSRYLVDLYQISLKNNKKMIGLNFVNILDLVNLKFFDVLDFFLE